MINFYEIMSGIKKKLGKVLFPESIESYNTKLLKIFSRRLRYDENINEKDLKKIKKLLKKLYNGSPEYLNDLFSRLKEAIYNKNHAIKLAKKNKLKKGEKIFEINQEKVQKNVYNYYFLGKKIMGIDAEKQKEYKVKIDEVCVPCIENAIRDDVHKRMYLELEVEEAKKRKRKYDSREMNDSRISNGESPRITKVPKYSIFDNRYNPNEVEIQYNVPEIENIAKVVNKIEPKKVIPIKNPFKKDVEAKKIVDNPFKNFQEISKESTKDKNAEIESKNSVKDDNENNTHSKNYIPTIVETSNNDLQKIDNRMCDANKSTLTSTNVNDSADFKPLITKQNEEYNKKPSSVNEIFDSNQPTAINYNKLTETKSSDLKEEDRIEFNNVFEQNNKFALPVFDNMKYQEQVENKKAKSNDYQQVHNSTSTFNIDNNNLLSQSAFQNNNLFNSCSNTSNNANQQQNSHETFLGKKFEFNSQPSSNVPPSFPQHQEQSPNSSVTNFSLQQPAFNMNDLSSGNFTNNNNDFNPFSNSNIFQKECDSNNDNQKSLFGNRNDNDADKNRKRKFYEEFF